ncbi:MAG: TonB-dependent receptor [Acidobacteria bacterium]|nr:TonB-dependent receptor [Acidobacteriota bacterium]
MALLAIALVLAVGFAPNASGQASDGNLVGTLTDQSGAAIPEANVDAVNAATGVKTSTRTNNVGVYRFNNLLVGQYNITITASGFLSQTIRNASVELNRTNTVNATLQVGTVSTTVEVSEAAAAIDTTTSQLSSTYNSRQAADLSLASNSNALGALNLSLLSAGVSSSGGVGYGTGPSVGGQRPTNNNFVIEGIDNNRRDVTGPISNVSNEATAEFTLLQNLTSPEFGHSSGGTFNTVVKSGTNTLHGSIYNYLQNRNFNALDAAFKRQGTSERTRYDQNRMGATVGGPIKRNKLFYFGNFEYNPLGQAGTTASEVLAPTAAGFSILDGLGSAINSTNYSIFKQYVTAAPSASRTTTVAGRSIPIGTLPIVAPSFSNSYNYIGSVDYEMSERDRLRFRLIGNNIRQIDTASTLPVFFSNIPTNQYMYAFTHFHNFSPTATNELRAAYTRFFQDIPVGNFSFPGLDMFPNIAVTEDLNLQLGPDPNGPQGTVINTYSLVDNFNWVKGRHTLKFGYDYRRVIAPQFFVQRVRGDYNYSGLDGFLRDLTPDVLAERSFGAQTFWGNLSSHYLFANDDFKVNSHLTINLGIRYEYVGSPAGTDLQALNSISSVPGLIDFHAPTTERANWAPRVGFAYSPGKSGDFVIRGGFGLAYDQLYQNLGILSLPPQFFTTVDVAPPDNDAPGFLRNGGIKSNLGSNLTAAEARAATASFVPDQVRPYSINWTLGVQKVIATNYTAEVRYVGTRGVHLPMQIRLNQGTVVTPEHSLPTFLQQPAQATLNALPLTLSQLRAEVDPISQRYLDAGFESNIVGFMPIGNSTYHGLATQLTRRFSRDLSFTGAYTWSHSIDDGTASVFSTLIAPRRVQDFQNLRPERSSSALDRRHRLSFSWMYDVAAFRSSQNWAAKNLLGNWTINGTYIAESPMYAVVQSNADANLNFDTAGDRSIINPAGDPTQGSEVRPLTNSANQTVAYLALNPNARYIRAQAGTYANGGRMTLPLRGVNNWDITVMKNFSISENKRIQLRAEMYNAFNHSQFTPGVPNGVQPKSRTDTRNYLIPGNPTFNNPETAFGNNPRVIQLVARFQF